MSASPVSVTSRLRRVAIRGVLGVVATALAATALAGCAPGDAAAPSGTPSGSPTSTEPTAPTTPSGTPTVDARAAMAGNLADAISSGNTAAVEGYLADPTRVVIAASDADSMDSPVDAVLALDYVHPGTGFWDFELDPQIVDVYRANPSYGQFFPSGAIVGRSSGGPVIAFVPARDRIGTIFMALDESLITEY